MYKKILKAVGYIALVYVAPLAARPELITTWQIGLLAAALATIILTQPDATASDAASDAATDKGSVAWILIAGLISQIAPVVEWAYVGIADRGGITVASICGIVLLVGGLTFRIWAIRTLGRHFTATVRTSDDHELIRSGPYAIVRHPSYTGAWVAIVGSAMVLTAPVGTLVAAVAMSVAYIKRLSAEELVLRDRFGEAYERYADSTPALLPWPGVQSPIQVTLLVVATLSLLTLGGLSLASSCLPGTGGAILEGMTYVVPN